MTTTKRPCPSVVILLFVLLFQQESSSSWTSHAFGIIPTSSRKVTRPGTQTTLTSLAAAPRRLQDNVDGPLYVNDKCINCAACSMFAPNSFQRRSNDGAHVVYHQPTTQEDVSNARTALAACPVAAIRVETNAQRRHNDQPLWSEDQASIIPGLSVKSSNPSVLPPFPKPLLPHRSDDNDVYFVGHHNEKTFGAAPYVLHTQQHGWIMIDTPKFSKSAVQAVTSLTGPDGPKYQLLTHVDDTADHGRWKEEFPQLQRIFHAGDLGRHNWIGDKTLEDVEVLLHETSRPDQLQYFDVTGAPLTETDSTVLAEDHEVLLLHTPGHSPGSLSLWRPPTSHRPGVLFTGDTYAYSTRRGGSMSGFPRYGNDRKLQAQILRHLLDLDWQVIAPGHGHVRDYTTGSDDRVAEMQPAIAELNAW